jgi:glutathione synthase/RimK-type ligase-like ATP-grasp enzyme
MAVLILSMPNDFDSHAVQWAIRKLGTDCDILYTADLAGGAEWSCDPEVPCILDTEYRDRRQRFDFDGYDSIWMRRPNITVPRKELADRYERAAAERESSDFTRSIFARIERGKFVASRFGATRICSGKTFQFGVAREVGLPMPPTLISNSPQRILRFYREHGGRIVYKPLVPNLFPRPGGGISPVPTTLIEDEALLRDNDLSSAPGIYQAVVDKVSEIRVTILGRSVFGVEKTFPERSAALDIDWRGMHSGAHYREHQLPEPLAQASIRLLRELGLVMGVFDFITDAAGNYYFLEVNPQGQFLWADQLVDVQLNHLEAMAEFLLSKDPEFRYARKDRVLCSEFNSQVDSVALKAREQQEHYGDLLTFRHGAVTFPLIEPMELPPEVIAAYVEAEQARLAAAALSDSTRRQ